MRNTFSILFAILCIFLIVLIARNGIEYSIGDVSFCLFTVVLAFFVYFYGQQHSILKNYWAKPGNILLLSLFIVNYQLVIDLLLGLREFSDFTCPSVVVRTCYVSTLGILSTILGLSYHSRLKTNRSLFPSRKINISFIVTLQVFLFIIWVATVNIGDLLSGSQYGVNSGIERQYWESFYNNSITVVLACVCLNCRDGRVKNLWQFLSQNYLISWVCIGLYMAFRLVSGDRGPVIYTGALLFFSYIYCTKAKVRLSLLAVIVFSGSVMLSLIGLARQDFSSGTFSQRLSNSYSEFDYKERYDTPTFFSPTLELARSYRCNEYAVSEIDERGMPLHYGSYQLFQLIGIFPFALSYISEEYNIPESMKSSGYYFTLIEKGDYYKYGQVGTTCVADFYMDFGLIGVLIGMFLLGYVFSRVDMIICSEREISPFSILIALSFASMAIYIGRATFISQIKPILVLLLMFYSNYYISKVRHI